LEKASIHYDVFVNVIMQCDENLVILPTALLWLLQLRCTV